MWKLPTVRVKGGVEPMRLIGSVAVVVLALTLPGCYALTLDPLFSGVRTPLDPRLLGTWGDDGTTDSTKGERWSFAAMGDSAYSVRIIEEGTLRGSFVGRAGRLNGALFMDLSGDDADTLCRGSASSPCEMNMLLAFPVHLILRLEVSDSSLAIFRPDGPTIVDEVKGLRKGDYRRMSDDGTSPVLFLGSGPKLRGFFGSLADSNVFRSLTLNELRRLPNAGQ